MGIPLSKGVAVITVVIVLATASLLSYAIVRRDTKGCLRI